MPDPSQIIGSVVLAVMGIVFWLLQEDNPLAMFRLAAERLKNLNQAIARTFHTSTTVIVRFEIGALLGFGFTMMQIGEWAISIACWVLFGFILIAKALAWEGVAGNKGLTAFLRFCAAAASLALCVFLITITALRKPDDEYWSNIQKLWDHPSFAYLAPGVVLNDNTWDFVVRHRGKNTNKSVEMFFTDVVRSQQLAEQHTKDGTPETPAEIDSFTRFLNIPEVNPLCRGHAFAIQLVYSAANFDHEHYSIEISSTEMHLHEDLRVERVAGKWYDAAEIKDVETGKMLMKCRDHGFPNSQSGDVACYPAIVNCDE